MPAFLRLNLLAAASLIPLFLSGYFLIIPALIGRMRDAVL